MTDLSDIAQHTAAVDDLNHSTGGTAGPDDGGFTDQPLPGMPEPTIGDILAAATGSSIKRTRDRAGRIIGMLDDLRATVTREGEIEAAKAELARLRGR